MHAERSGVRLYYLGYPQDALVALLPLLESSTHFEIPFYCALCQAQLRKVEETRAMIAKLEETSITNYIADAHILTNAWLGNYDETERRFANKVPRDSDYGAPSQRTLHVDTWASDGKAYAFYDSARVAAQVARILRERVPTLSTSWKQRAIELLQRALESNADAISRCVGDWALIPLWDEPAFRSIASGVAEANSYAGIRRRDKSFEPLVAFGYSLGDQQFVGRQLIVDGYRPTAVAVKVASGSNALEPVITWRRPRVAEPWDPVQRTAFIEEFPKWHGRLNNLATVLTLDDDPSLLSGICLALGSIEEVNQETKDAVKPLLSGLYVHNSDGGVHSATWWALNAWELPVPSLKPSEAVQPEFKWQVTKTNLTLMLVKKGRMQLPESNAPSDSRRIISLDHDLWMSDREITVGQYKPFYDVSGGEQSEPKHFPRMSDNANESLSGVSWYEAVQFCNWLSMQDRLSVAYRKVGREAVSEGLADTIVAYDAWELVPNSEGFRLPTSDEWEYACRTKTTTRFFFGNDHRLIDRYAVDFQNSERSLIRGATKMCNSWGLFDMYGGVPEWLHDRIGQANGRGIVANWSVGNGSSLWLLQPVAPSSRSQATGFRVVRGPVDGDLLLD